MTSNKQEELFIINDINMSINPSDVQVMDDNWVMEDSYLRSKAVFCYRSQYSATKVVLNIPFQITNLNEVEATELNNTYNCIRLVTELNNYPFCFIRNQRIRNYISPSSISETGYLMFAVDEISLVKHATASNILFLEVVLQYYNHKALIQDFTFRSNLDIDVTTVKNQSEETTDGDVVRTKTSAQKALDKVYNEKDKTTNSNAVIVRDIAPLPCASLQDSAIWQKFIRPKENKIYSELLRTGLMPTSLANAKSTHPSMGVKILTPLMFSINEDEENFDDGRLLENDCKVITVTNTSKYDNGTFENLLATLAQQDFTSDSVFENNSEFSTNGERIIKEGTTTTKDSRAQERADKLKAAVKLTEKQSKEQSEETTNSERAPLSGSTSVFIQWQGDSLEDLQLGVTSIKVSKKNRLVSHQISSFKHPVIQYMGRYPTTVSVSMTSVNHDIYKTDDNFSPNVFIKQILNILDFNKNNIPEAEAYNFLKIRSLATLLMGCENFVPSQSAVSASANHQGVENIVYTFHESDMSTFIEDGTVQGSGRLSTTKASAEMTEIVIRWLTEFTKIFSKVINDKTNQETYSHALNVFKLIVQLGIEAYDELGFEDNNITKALEYYGKIIEDLRASNNLVKTVEIISKDLAPKQFSKYTLYIEAIAESIEYVDNPDYDPNKERKLNRKLGSKLNNKKVPVRVVNKNATKASLHTIFSAFIPFIVTTLTTRQNVKEGRGSTVGGISFSEGGKYKSLLDAIAKQLEMGLKNGEEAAANSIDTEEVRDFFEQYSKDYSGVFFGYNYEDLDLEDISPIPYNRETDLLVQNIDPFFFLIETTHLDGNELQNMYDAMYSETEQLDEIPSAMNTEDNLAKNNVDGTAAALGIEYRKLQEIEYRPPVGFGVLEDTNTGDRELDRINSLYNNAKNKYVPPIPDKYIAAIEKALKHYGLQDDHNFRQLIYAFLHVESTNGKNLRSATGALGLFQITDDAMAQIMMNNNKVIDSTGEKLPSGLSKSDAKAKAPRWDVRLLSDHFLNASIAIEYIQWIRRNYADEITLNGVQNPVLIYMGYNIGVGSLKEANDLGSRRIATGPTVMKNIKAQGDIKGVVWNGNDYETFTSYMKVIADRSFSFNNVPEHLRPQNKAAVEAATPAVVKKVVEKDGLKNLAKKIYNDANNNVVYEATKNNGPLIFKKIEENNKNVDAIDKKLNNFYVTSSKKDKANLVTAGNLISGQVVSKKTAQTVEDGDTLYFIETKTGKEYPIRLSGIDTPETTHVVKGKETGMAEVFGKRAQHELNRLIFGKTVTLMDMGPDLVSKNRRVGKIILPDGTDPALTLLRNGLGFVPDNFTTDGAYKKAETEARENNKGIWSVPNGIVYKPRQREERNAKGEITKVTPVSEANVDAAKAPAKLKFTSADLKYAEQANANQLNNYQPLTGGPYRVSSYFGPRKGGLHKGVDFACSKGTVVVAAAGGFARARDDSGQANGTVGYGWYIEIDHGNGFKTRYGHLSKRFVDYKGKQVAAGEQIGLTGGVPKEVGSGRTTGAHLHYEVRYNGKPVNPFGTRLLTEYKEGDPAGVGTGNTTLPTVDISAALASMTPRVGVTDENTVYNEDKLAAAIFERMNKYTNIGLKSSLPAIKVYLTIGNENDHFWLSTLKTGVQYYELKGIKSFSMFCNNDTNPLDTVIMEIADPSFLNTDSFMGLKKMQGVVANKIGTDFEMQFTNNHVLLKAGAKLHIRCGYSNNPSELDVVFNGTITDISITNPQNLQVICESFSKELLSEVLAPDEPQMLNDQNDNISTSGVIGEALMSKSITHFGYSSGFWADKFKDSIDPEDRSLAPGTFSFSYNWGWDMTAAKYKSRIFSNVFAPEIEALDTIYRDKIPFYRDWIQAFSGLYTQGYPFAVYKMTPWDCLKQMEYRHPGTICKPKWFEDRMTLFYGVKEQMYFAKDINKITQQLAANQKEGNNPDGYALSDYHEKRRERMLPAVDMHLITSSHNLISNGLRLNTSYSTVTNVNYTDSQDEEIIATPWKMKSTKIKMDDNIFSWDLREKNLTLSSCISKYMAFCYGTTDLKKEAEKMYMGKILILGNPTLKAGDYVFLDDSEKRMQGLILVRECYHFFDDRRGFVTEIVPGQYVEAANFMYSSLWFKLMCCSKVATSKLRNITKANYTAKDFNMVFDYLTIMNQLEIALDKIENKGIIHEAKENSMYALSNGSIAALSIYITNQLAGLIGIKPWALGINLGRGVVGLPANFIQLWLSERPELLAKLGRDAWAATASIYKMTDTAEKISGTITKAKQTTGGIKFRQYASKLRDSVKTTLSDSKEVPKTVVGKAFHYTGRLLSSPFRFSAVGASRASVFAGRVVARAMLVGLMAIPLAGVATILLDVVAAFIIQWAFDKMEENKLIRQPLLFFPITRHGKPYVAGMAGMVRNSWWDSKKTEWGKTVKDVTKAAEIITENGKLAGNENNTFIKILNSVGQGAANKRANPSYVTDLQGNALKLNKNGEVVVKESNGKVEKNMLDRLIEQEQKSLSDESKNKQQLKQELSKVTGENVGRNPER